MDKKQYEQLKKLDGSVVRNYVYESFRNSVEVKNHQLYAYSLMYLALKQKEKGEIDLKSGIEKDFKNETVRNHLTKIVEKEKDLIANISSEFDEEVLKAAILFSDARLVSDVADNSTPIGLTKLAAELLSIEEQDVILDMGSGAGDFLANTMINKKSRGGFGVEIATDNIIISSLRAQLLELDIKYIQGNILSQDFTYVSATKVFSNFPLGVRLSSLEGSMENNSQLKPVFKNAKRTVTGDWVYVQAAYNAMKPGGKCVCIMSNSGTWNEADEEIRKSLIEEGIIEGVIALPAKLLPSTAIPLTMIILSSNNNHVKMVDATNIYSEGRRQNTLENNDVEKIFNSYKHETEHSRVIKKDEFSKNEFALNPIRYINSADEIEDGWSFEEIATSINRGAMINSKTLDELITNKDTGFSYLMLQNISDGQIDKALPNLTSIDDKYEKYCIENNSLIISKISPFKIAWANFEDDRKVLANGNLYFIKIDDTKVNPVYVEAFLQSEAGIAQLIRLSKGTVMSNISIKDLKKVKVPKISREKQDKIANEFEDLKDQLIILEKQIDLVRNKRAQILEGVV